MKETIRHLGEQATARLPMLSHKRQLSGGETGSPFTPVDIEGNREQFVNIVQRLMSAETEGYSQNRLDLNSEVDHGEVALDRAARELLVAPFWPHLTRKENRGPRYPFIGVQNFIGEHLQIEGADVFTSSQNAKLSHGVILGNYAFTDSKSPSIDSSLVCGLRPFAGSPAFTGSTSGQIEAFANAYKAARDNDGAALHAAVEAFDREITPELRDMHSYAENNPVYNQNGDDLCVATHMMESIGASLTEATINIDVNNSIVYGMSGFLYTVGGQIKDSVIGGIRPLNEANVHLINTTVVTPEGTEHFDDAYIGNPALAHIGRFSDKSSLPLGLPFNQPE